MEQQVHPCVHGVFEATRLKAHQHQSVSAAPRGWWSKAASAAPQHAARPSVMVTAAIVIHTAPIVPKANSAGTGAVILSLPSAGTQRETRRRAPAGTLFANFTVALVFHPPRR